MAIGRGSMRQQITKGPQKKKFLKKRRVRIVMGNKNQRARRRQVDTLSLLTYNKLKELL